MVMNIPPKENISPLDDITINSFLERFWLLDPLGPLTTLSMSAVKSDGSSCKEMAVALR